MRHAPPGSAILRRMGIVIRVDFRRRRPIRKRCPHPEVAVDESKGEVACRRCGRIVDPVPILARMVREMEPILASLKEAGIDLKSKR